MQQGAVRVVCCFLTVKISDMISDFELLAEKIGRLAELTATLRRENAALRRRNAELLGEQGMVNERLQQARERIASLISTLPPSLASKEEAGK